MNRLIQRICYSTVIFMLLHVSTAHAERKFQGKPIDYRGINVKLNDQTGVQNHVGADKWILYDLYVNNPHNTPIICDILIKITVADRNALDAGIVYEVLNEYRAGGQGGKLWRERRNPGHASEDVWLRQVFVDRKSNRTVGFIYVRAYDGQALATAYDIRVHSVTTPTR